MKKNLSLWKTIRTLLSLEILIPVSLSTDPVHSQSRFCTVFLPLKLSCSAIKKAHIRCVTFSLLRYLHIQSPNSHFWSPCTSLPFHLHYFLFPLFAPICTELRKGSLDIISLLPLPSCCFLNFVIFLHWIAFPFLSCGLKCLLSTSPVRGSSGPLTAKLKEDLFLLTLENHILPGHSSFFFQTSSTTHFPVWCSGFSNLSSVLPVSWQYPLNSVHLLSSIMQFFPAYFTYQRLSL